VNVDDGESAERDSGSAGQLAADQFHYLVDLTVTLTQVHLHSQTHSAYHRTSRRSVNKSFISL